MPRLLFFFLIVSCCSCEQAFNPEVSTDPPEVVVEGYIEGGERPLPPYVILTRSVPFFSQINAQGLNNLFVHDAEVNVSDGDQTVELAELCLSELTPGQRLIASELLGVDLTDFAIDICIYTDTTFSMFGEIGKTYTLEIEVGDKLLHAVTSIPTHVPLDSLRFYETEGEPIDTLAELRVFLSDPEDEANFYRYFTRTNDKAFKSPFTSVVDDRLFNGLEFEFPLPNAEVDPEGIRPSTYGLFRVGDTVTVRWTNLDRPHFEFWNTLEFNSANQGPFSSYTRIQSNVDGGLGVWGGYSATYYEMIVEK